MITENLSTLKIHKLTQEQYDRELASGNIDENALYLTPDVVTDVDELINMIDEYKEETNTALSGKSDTTHTHDNYEEVGVAATKANEALESAKSYTDQEIADLINAAPETLDTLGELAAAMKENQDVVDVLNNAITLKANKEEVTNELEEINGEIENINEELEDKLSFDEEVIDSTSSFTKIVPENSGKYASVDKVGGMSYKSRNLLEVTATSGYNSGITYTVNDNGTVAANGTASGTFTLFLNSDVQKNLSIGKTYKTSDNTLTLQITKTDGSKEYVRNFTYDSTIDRVGAYIQLSSGSTVNTIYYPMILEADETDTSYEPYYSGIRNAEVSEVKSVGKNLLNVPQEITAHSKTYIFKELPITLNAGNYVFSFISSISQSSSMQFTVWKEGLSDTLYNKVFGTDANTRVELPFTLKSAETVILYFYANVDNVTITNCQIEVGTTATEYEPYKETSLPIPDEVKALDGYGLGVDEECCNYIDFAANKFIKKVIRPTILGNISASTLTGSDGILTHGCSIWSSDIKKPSASEVAKLIVPGYTTVAYNDFRKADKQVAVAENGVLWFRNDSITTTVGYLYKLASYVIYELATPIETDISDLLQGNSIEVQSGGIVTLVNKYNYNVPNEISFYTSETPEKVIVADKFVGDVVNTVEKSKSLEGLESTIEELNYLKGAKGNIQDQIDNIETGSHTHNVATVSEAGFMSATDKSRLDNLNSRIQLGTGCNLVYDSTNKCVSFQFL